MGRGQGQGSQDRTLRTQGRVYAMVPQAERSDQSDMQGTFYTCNCYMMHHVHYCILCDGFGLEVEASGKASVWEVSPKD